MFFTRKFHSSCSAKLVLLTVIGLGCAGTTQAQCTQKISELPASPELRGFKLGMTKEDVKTSVPQTVFGRTDAFGVSKTTINPYFDSRIDKPRFAGIRSVSLDFLDDHLTSLWIGYDETFKVQTIDEFIKLISESLQVPDQWLPWKSRGRQLSCGDFQLIVTTVAGGPSLRIIDTAAEDLIAARRQAKEERDSAVETAADGIQSGEEIVGDRQTHIFYMSVCRAAKDIAPANKVIFKSVEDAEKAGFKSADNCH